MSTALSQFVPSNDERRTSNHERRPCDVIVIGGGHNGLIASTFLAKAGLEVVVLERSDRIGGCARTGDLAPGFRCPTLAHTAAIDPAVVRSLELERQGLRIIRPGPHA